MCDEYDDERMRVLWQRLEQPVTVEDFREAPTEIESAPIGLLSDPGVMSRTRPKALSR